MWRVRRRREDFAGLPGPPYGFEVATGGVRAVPWETSKELHLEDNGFTPGLLSFIFYSCICETFFLPTQASTNPVL